MDILMKMNDDEILTLLLVINRKLDDNKITLVFSFYFDLNLNVLT